MIVVTIILFYSVQNEHPISNWHKKLFYCFLSAYLPNVNFNWGGGAGGGGEEGMMLSYLYDKCCSLKQSLYNFEYILEYIFFQNKNIV